MGEPKKHLLWIGFDDGTVTEVLIRPIHRTLAREKLGDKTDVERLTYFAAYRALGVQEPFELWMDSIVAADEELVPFVSTTNSDTGRESPLFPANNSTGSLEPTRK